MTKDEIKIYIAELLNQGISLSDIQKKLQIEKSLNITFLDLRLIASEINSVDWSKQNKIEKTTKAENKKLQPSSDSDEKELSNEVEEEISDDSNEKYKETIGGETVVEVSRLTRPGALAHGSVKFISGVKADWILDQMGRLGLDKSTGEPTAEDIKGFQTELQKLLSRGM